jgi:hypothetical protein
LVPTIAQQRHLGRLDLDPLRALAVLTAEKRAAEAAGKLPVTLLRSWLTLAVRYGLAKSGGTSAKVRSLELDPRTGKPISARQQREHMAAIEASKARITSLLATKLSGKPT